MTPVIHQIACQRIISGGQSGVDRGALDACLEKKFPCSGWCPKGRLAEDGVIDPKYPLTETEDGNYDTRTLKNVQDSAGTMIISTGNLIGGTLLTHQIAQKINKPVLVVSPGETNFNKIISEVFCWLKGNNIDVLNVAGPRKSEWEQGYYFSHQIISALIIKIKTSND
jgi:hypothetical protein